MKMLAYNVLAIYRRELQSYFASPLAYAIATIYWILAGILFKAAFDGVIDQGNYVDLQAQSGVPISPIDVPYELLRTYLGVMGSLSLFVLPILSMGLYADERKRGTLELLATSPITNWAVAIGKLLGVLTFFITMSLPLLLYEAIALNGVDPPVPLSVILLGHAGLILLAASVLSLGMFVSSLTDSTILAAILTFALVLCLWIISELAKNFGGIVGDALFNLSLLKHYTNLVQGVVDTSSLVLFASYIFLGIFLTAQSIDALRFQRS
ncbi:ABC transporter permease [Phormidesmis priestleyi]|uniref:ABC transporter permease n=1 Tax=Phormidesmis priestleyi TaxID=268141 RepID=UPI00083B6307|nr:ABC transporter permease [Phormidesmis priestleyi]